MKPKVVTAQDIIAGAVRKHRHRPKIRFPFLSADLNAQVNRMANDPMRVRRGASPFVRELLGRMRKP